ncbi:MAG TPA: polysaccharide deacetylase family protein [Lacunisphaera sp.]|nr:polysaccharide deacetylase family protein [Lacunisphaera sp.]
MWFILLQVAGKGAALVVGLRHPVLAGALWFGPDLVLAYHVFSPHAQGLLRLARRFHPQRPEVWLTIDDGPDPTDTPQILALLAAHGARATFFVIGERAARYPEIIRAIVAAGHEVAHHTQTHPLATFWYASPTRVARELDAALAVLGPLGVKPTRFRPPAGIKNPWLAAALRARRLEAVGWSARGLEIGASNPHVVADRVLRDLAPGAILLMHEGTPVPQAIRVTAIRRVLEQLQARGYQCVIPPAAQLG